MSLALEMNAATLPVLVRKIIKPSFFGQHEIDPVKVDAIRVHLGKGGKVPPAVVVRYGDRVLPLDGHHRMSAYRDLGRPADVLECDGEEFEDFCIEVGSAEGDRLMLAQAARLTCGYDK